VNDGLSVSELAVGAEPRGSRTFSADEVDKRESARGPLTADALRCVAVAATEGRRDSLPAP